MRTRRQYRTALIFLLFLLFSMIVTTRVYADDETKVAVKLEGRFYELPDNKAYSFGTFKPTEVMSYGKPAVGELVMRGTINKSEPRNGMSAYGVTGNVTFTYTYENNVTDSKREGWYITSDREKKVINKKLDTDILHGALIIQKSYDGAHFEDVTNPVCDFFNQETQGVELYSSSGEDISRGVYYRFIIAYKTVIHDGGFIPTKLRHMEVYDCYVVENSGIISVHNLSLNEEMIENEEYSQESLKHGETLLDQSVTRDGFQIESFSSSYEVKVQKENEDAVIADSSMKFTEDGKYIITTKTKLGKKTEQTIYVFSGGHDRGYATYFGNGFVQGERVFRDGIIPTYARGSKVQILKVGNGVPPLNGSLVDIKTGQTVYSFSGRRDLQSFSLEPGEYKADLYNGDRNAVGSIYHYTFSFKVIDEDANPYVNYHILQTREELKDLSTKHYEVAYPTTLGGFVFVCFDLNSYDEALKYAREIEARFVEKASDGGFYYKSEDNPNHKVKYVDRSELTRVSEKYAKSNVEIDYFNPLDKFTYQTYDNNLLECLEDINTSESIKVFPSQDEKEKMIDRSYYLNDFTFTKAADYDVVAVVAESKNSGEDIPINLDRPVDEQLKETSRYKITESNIYGRIRTYDAVYVNECQTKSVWNIKNSGEESTLEVSAEAMQDENKLHVTADSAYVTDISNEYDEWAIVTIKAPGVYSFENKCLVSELKNLELDKAGSYQICFIDRLGNSYELDIDISGKYDIQNKQKFTHTYAEFYNLLHTNQQDVREDYMDLSVLAEEQKAEEQRKKEESEFESTATAQEGTSGELSNGNDSPKQKSGSKGVMILFGIVAICGAAFFFFKKNGPDSEKLMLTDSGGNQKSDEDEKDESEK